MLIYLLYTRELSHEVSKNMPTMNNEIILAIFIFVVYVFYSFCSYSFSCSSLVSFASAIVRKRSLASVSVRLRSLTIASFCSVFPVRFTAQFVIRSRFFDFPARRF